MACSVGKAAEDCATGVGPADRYHTMTIAKAARRDALVSAKLFEDRVGLNDAGDRVGDNGLSLEVQLSNVPERRGASRLAAADFKRFQLPIALGERRVGLNLFREDIGSVVDGVGSVGRVFGCLDEAEGVELIGNGDLATEDGEPVRLVEECRRWRLYCGIEGGNGHLSEGCHVGTGERARCASDGAAGGKPCRLRHLGPRGRPASDRPPAAVA